MATVEVTANGDPPVIIEIESPTAPPAVINVGNVGGATGPRGPKGDKGDQGIAGPHGPGMFLDIQVFPSVGTFTWNKPAGAVQTLVQLCSGGGGGGSGRKGAAGSVRCGGGGGNGGGYSELMYDATKLPPTVQVTVGAGGAGGAAVSAADTNGNPGTIGDPSRFQTTAGAEMLLYAIGGNPGTGGTNAAGTGGAVAQAMYPSTAGGNASTTGAAGANAGSTTVGCRSSGGGAGGGITTGDAASNGGTGGFIATRNINNAGGIAPGGVGGDATLYNGVDFLYPGGGGGASSVTGNAGRGGNGLRGSGGGGGGAAVNGVGNSGAGGKGGDGYAIVFTWCNVAAGEFGIDLAAPLASLATDEQFAFIRERMAEGPNIWNDHIALVNERLNVGAGGNPATPIPGRPVRQKYRDPAYTYLTYPVVDRDEMGCGFTDDGIAVFTQCIWWKLYNSTVHRDAALAGLMHWATTNTFFDHRTADGTGRGKFWAGTGVARFCWGAMLLWPHMSDMQRAQVADWLYVVFMDSRTTTQNRGTVLAEDGSVLRPNTQGGGSLLDVRSGPNFQAIFATARLSLGLVIRQVDEDIGQAIVDNAMTYFHDRQPCWARLNGPDEPVSPTFGAPYPPPPDANGYDTMELLSQGWYLSLAANPTYGDNFLGGLAVDGLIADIGRDGGHGMFTGEAFTQFLVIARNNGYYNLDVHRFAVAMEKSAKWLNEAADECWLHYGGNWTTFDASTWLPSQWADHGIGTRGGPSTGGSTTPGAPSFDCNGAGSVGGGWYIAYWLFVDQLGMNMPELERFVKRVRGVPNADGGHDGVRGPDGPAAGAATVNSAATTNNGSPYMWGPLLWTPLDEAA